MEVGLVYEKCNQKRKSMEISLVYPVNKKKQKSMEVCLVYEQPIQKVNRNEKVWKLAQYMK